MKTSARYDVGAKGRIEGIETGTVRIPVRSDVRIFTKGWKKSRALSEAADIRVERTATGQTWKATLEEKSEAAFSAEQSVVEATNGITLALKATALYDCEVEGVCLTLDFPIDAFADGEYAVGSSKGVLPAKLGDPYILRDAVEDSAMCADALGRFALNIKAQPATRILLQDCRKWAPEYGMYVFLHSGSIVKGQSKELKVVLSTACSPTGEVAQLALDPTNVLYRIRGAGGNYYLRGEQVKGMREYTLGHLNVGMARIGIWLDEWMPRDPAGGTNTTDRKAQPARDLPGTELRRDFEFQRELSRKKIPYIASVFKLPAWLYTKPPAEPDAAGNRVAAGKWPQMLDCIGSYLKHAKDDYQAEPDFFSFNEADAGYYVAMTADEHREAIKRFGGLFARLGLKTRLLLGDIAPFARGTDWLVPASKDQEAMRYVGAVSFHTYGMSPSDIRQWADFARQLKLPLFAAEVGVDPQSWKLCIAQDYGYALRELEMFQNVLLNGRPETLLYWEYGGSCWSLLQYESGQEGKLAMSERFCFQKHWCDLTPPGSEALAVSSDNANILFTAFRHGGKDGGGLSLHLANLSGARRARILGMPAGIRRLNRIVTARAVMFKAVDTVVPADGAIEVHLPARSLTTLTTIEAKTAP